MLSEHPMSANTEQRHYTRGRSGKPAGPPCETCPGVTMRLTLGSTAPSFTAESLGGRRVSLDQLRGRPLLLKFYRFATCPVCNLHMHKFIGDYRMVAAAGLTTVAFYHSPPEQLAMSQREATPFDLVPDPQKIVFTAYGVERGLRGMMSPAVVRDYARALAQGYPSGMFTHDGGVTGKPADFIVDANGRVAFAHYGSHYADSLNAPDVVDVWRGLQSQAAKRSELFMAAR
jgi:thioredoxin-dependent peroxiredoxin